MKKNASAARVRNLIFLAILIGWMGLVGITVYSNYQTHQQLKERRAELESELDNARLQLEGEKRMLEYAKSDEYMERMARKMFNMVREDEVIYQPRNPKSATPSDATQEEG
jgi:Septum formation initiator